MQGRRVLRPPPAHLRPPLVAALPIIVGHGAQRWGLERVTNDRTVSDGAGNKRIAAHRSERIAAGRSAGVRSAPPPPPRAAAARRPSALTFLPTSATDISAGGPGRWGLRTMVG